MMIKFITISSLLLLTADAFSKEKIDTTMKAMSILTKHCSVCHNQEKHPGALFLNEAKLTQKETISLMIRLIETGQMPQQHKRFAKSQDGKLLLAWLKEQEKLK